MKYFRLAADIWIKTMTFHQNHIHHVFVRRINSKRGQSEIPSKKTLVTVPIPICGQRLNVRNESKNDSFNARWQACFWSFPWQGRGLQVGTPMSVSTFWLLRLCAGRWTFMVHPVNRLYLCHLFHHTWCFSKNLVFDHFEEKNCSGTVFSNPNALLRPVMLPNAF